MAGKVTDITGTDFMAVTGAAEALVLVDFWSPTCGPCRTLAPILDDLAADFAGEVQVCKGDVSADPALGERFAVGSLPTLALCLDGVEVDRVIGLKSRAQLTRWIESHL